MQAAQWRIPSEWVGRPPTAVEGRGPNAYREQHTAAARAGSMAGKRFILNPIRTSKQGQQINVGKEYAEYEAMVTTLTMHPDDMKELPVTDGGTVRVRTEVGEADFRVKEGKVPRGLLFVPYGPPT